MKSISALAIRYNRRESGELIKLKNGKRWRFCNLVISNGCIRKMSDERLSSIIIKRIQSRRVKYDTFLVVIPIYEGIGIVYIGVIVIRRSKFIVNFDSLSKINLPYSNINISCIRIRGGDFKSLSTYTARKRNGANNDKNSKR